MRIEIRWKWLMELVLQHREMKQLKRYKLAKKFRPMIFQSFVELEDSFPFPELRDYVRDNTNDSGIYAELYAWASYKGSLWDENGWLEKNG